MKKLLPLVLLLATVLVAAAGYAQAADGEPLAVQVTFDGEYWEFEDYNFKIMLPTDWVEAELENVDFVLVSPDESQLVGIHAEASEGETLETIVEQFLLDEAYENVASVFFNDIPFVLYNNPENNLFGAFTLTDDGTELISIIFSPMSNPGISELAMQIMASIVPLDT